MTSLKSQTYQLEIFVYPPFVGSTLESTVSCMILVYLILIIFSINIEYIFFKVYIDVGQELNELNRETGFAATIDAMFALIVGTRQLRWSTCHQRLFS